MNAPDNSRSSRRALIAILGSFLIFMANAFAQERAGIAEVERVIVTGSNIPTAEETGPNPVDTYRQAHIDSLKDADSAVYGSDAVTGVVNFFLLHKFRGLEIGGSYGNTNLGASNDMGEWEAWIKAGTGDDKTDIVVVADFWERTGGLFSADRDLS